MLLRASLLRLARVRNCSSKSRIDSGSGRPLVELAADQQPLRMAVKFAFAAFMTYEVYDLFLKSDTLFINGYVRLASSKDAYNVATGVSRMSRLRDSDAALAEVVACGGVEMYATQAPRGGTVEVLNTSKLQVDLLEMV